MGWGLYLWPVAFRKHTLRQHLDTSTQAMLALPERKRLNSAARCRALAAALMQPGEDFRVLCQDT